MQKDPDVCESVIELGDWSHADPERLSDCVGGIFPWLRVEDCEAVYLLTFQMSFLRSSFSNDSKNPTWSNERFSAYLEDEIAHWESIPEWKWRAKAWRKNMANFK